MVTQAEARPPEKSFGNGRHPIKAVDGVLYKRLLFGKRRSEFLKRSCLANWQGGSGFQEAASVKRQTLGAALHNHNFA